jgi:Flp pilus assembly protein TadG
MTAAATPGHHRDQGTLTLFTVVVAVGLLAAIGFITDAGQKLAAAAQAQAVAEEAARAGAAEVNQSAAYSGTGRLTVDPALAVEAARAYLASTGNAGTITVTGPTLVTVTVTVTKPAVFGEVIGISQLSATETATAQLTVGVTGPPP